jgi:hypothetical protein
VSASAPPGLLTIAQATTTAPSQTDLLIIATFLGGLSGADDESRIARLCL